MRQFIEALDFKEKFAKESLPKIESKSWI